MTRTFTITQSGVSRSFTVNNGVGPQGPTGATGATGATGSQGPAGPNSVTASTSTDLVGILAGDGANVFVFDASAEPTADALVLYNSNAEIQAKGFFSIDDGGGLALLNTAETRSVEIQHGLNVMHILYDGSVLDLNIQGLGIHAQVFPTGSGKFALTQTANGEPDKLTDGTISGTLAVNSTSFTYGTGAAAAHRAALGVASSQLQTESLFSLLTLQESDAGVYTANAGTAVASADGDNLTLSASTANQRPNVYRLRNWSRNPGISSSANPVMPVKLASAGNIVHSGSAANGASFRCGIGMVNGASAVAANANATTGCGFGWRIAWNSTTSKLEFNLWAHDGTTYTEGTGIDTGLGASNLDGFFNVIVCLAADGTVTANTWFGINTALSTPSTTPTATLAGGPTSGTFANQGIPCWLVAAHSSTAPSGVNSIMVKIINRKLGNG